MIETIGISLSSLIDEEDGLMVDKTRFYTVQIRDIQFHGVISTDGPYLSAQKGSFTLEGVSLGDIAQIWETEKDRKSGWFVCKYGSNQPRIFLEDFTTEDVVTLADAFGIGIWGTPIS